MRIGILGAGKIGRTLRDMLLAIPGIEGVSLVAPAGLPSSPMQANRRRAASPGTVIVTGHRCHGKSISESSPLAQNEGRG